MRVLYQVPPQGATTARIGVDILWITLFYFYVPHPLTFCPDSAEPLGTPTPGGASKIARQKNLRIPRHINIDMKRFLQYLSESAFDIHSLDYDANHGESFRWAYTPKDQPGKFSIVTPSNGEAWTDWKPVSPEHSDMLRDKWNKHKEAGTLNDFVAPHKINQIEQHAV